MRTPHPLMVIRLATVALCAAVLTACGSSSPPADAAKPSPASPSEGSSAAPPPDGAPAPKASPAEPAQPAPEAPAPSESSPVAKPTSTSHLVGEPSLAAMRPAERSAKMSVPVDLRYSFSADPVTGQPTVLHLAAVPRVGGTNLNVSIKQESGVQVEMAPGAANIQKASAASVYRKQMAVTRTDPAATRVRVLVTMDFAAGSGFGFFTIPLDAAPASSSTARKQDLVKQH
jgi:hypothetical protein